MIAFLAIPLLVCGLIWITTTPKEQFRVSAYQGWLVYLHAAKLGLYHFIFVYIIFEMVGGSLFDYIIRELVTVRIDNKLTPTNIVSYFLIDFLPEKIKTSDRTETAAYLLSLSFIFVSSTAILSIATKGAHKRFNYRRYYLRKYWKDNNPFDYFLLESVEKEKPVLITLEDRKCYAGFIWNIQEPNEESTGHKEVALAPFLSGYRDKDTLLLLFLNSYKKEDECKFIFPREKIVSISWFDLETYLSTNNNREEG